MRPLAATLVCVLCIMPAMAQSNRSRHNNSQPGSFDYYLLSLSYAPDFCAENPSKQTPQECGTGRHIGFVVHGLWPQDTNGRGPENCGHASPVSQAIVQVMLNYIPTASLIQHEWTTHGTCSGLSAADFFTAVRKARDSVTIPADLNQPAQKLSLSPADIETRFATANASFPKGAFTVACYNDGELQEARICFNKDLTPRACTASAGQCSVGTVTLLPVR